MFGTRVERWAHDRGIIQNTTIKDQFVKFIEEVGELSEAIQKKDTDLMMDAIGDCSVVLAVMAAQIGTKLEDCQGAAYDVISHRKGQIFNGVFVREK